MANFGWLIPIIIIFTIFGLPVLLKNAEGRRTFLLELKKEERRIAEAKARELELEQKRRELEYREALLELERFDRRGERPPLPKVDPEDEERPPTNGVV